MGCRGVSCWSHRFVLTECFLVFREVSYSLSCRISSLQRPIVWYSQLIKPSLIYRFIYSTLFIEAAYVPGTANVLKNPKNSKEELTASGVVSTRVAFGSGFWGAILRSTLWIYMIKIYNCYGQKRKRCGGGKRLMGRPACKLLITIQLSLWRYRQGQPVNTQEFPEESQRSGI